MRVKSLNLQPVELALKEPLATARGSILQRPGVLLRLHVKDVLGTGELTPLPGAGTETLQDALAWLNANAAQFAGQLVTDVEDWVERQVPAHLVATRCAVECALLDAQAQLRDVPVCVLLGMVNRVDVPVGALLSPATADEAVAMERAGHKVVKVKLGMGASDVAHVSALRAVLGPQVRIRVDANRAWSMEQALSTLSQLAPLGIELCEDPLRDPVPADLLRLSAQTGVALAADEYLADLRVREALLEARAVDTLVLKLPVLGGLCRTLNLARRADLLGMRTVVTSLLDGAVARAAAAHVAACLPLSMRPAGLGTARLMATDVSPDPMVVRAGSIRLPARAGLGFPASWQP